MSYKPTLSNDDFDAQHRALQGYRIVTIEGPDASGFAQAQFMNDVSDLLPGDWQWNGWLTPKGRVIALFALLKLDETSIWLLVLDASPADFAERLQRFVFRSKVAVRASGDWNVSGALHASLLASGAHFTRDAKANIELDFGTSGVGRSLRISEGQHLQTDTEFESTWAAYDLQHGLPRLSAAQSEQWTPQQLSLDRLRAYSVKKGCYPGQEIVARTHFLGEAKRHLALMKIDLEAFEAMTSAPMHVYEKTNPLGAIISAANDQHHAYLLAVLPSITPDSILTLGPEGPAVKAQAFIDGLTR